MRVCKIEINEWKNRDMAENEIKKETKNTFLCEKKKYISKNKFRLKLETLYIEVNSEH